MNLYNYLLQNITSQSSAVIQGKKAVSYAEIIDLSERIGSSLRAFGIQRGDRVGIIGHNSDFWISSYLGILRIGAIVTPLPSRVSTIQLGDYLALANCSTYCIDPSQFRRVQNFLPGNSKVIVPPKANLHLNENHQMNFEYLEPDGQSSVADVHDDDIAALMFTSGTTGKPNAVQVSHRNIIANTTSIIEYLQLSASDRMMVVLPFSYCFGTSLLHSHFRAGGSLVINNETQYIEDLLNELDFHQCTGLAGVPTFYQSLMRNSSFSSRKFPHLRHLQQAGGKLPNRFIEELLAILPSHTKLFIMYGQTEATARLSYLDPNKLPEKLGSIGKGIPGVILEVLNEDGVPVNAGQIGEIVASGDNITKGYLVDDSTKKPFRNGKLYTGDLAKIDEDGYIYIVGRSGDFIKPSGFRVGVAQIEDTLLEFPDILEVAVIGVPHDQLGEAAKAFVVLKPGSVPDKQKIVGYCKGRIPDYAIPTEVQFLSELPRNSSGKVAKTDLDKQ